jgi:hypothetical protein
MKKIISLVLACLYYNATAAVTSVATVITGNGSTRVTQLEVMSSSLLAGTVNRQIQPGGIISNSKWNLLLRSDESIISIDGITIQLTGPTGAVLNLFLVGLAYEVNSSMASPTLGAYNSIGSNISSANGQIVYEHIFAGADDVKTVVIADATFENTFGGGLYNPTALGEVLTMTWGISGQTTSGPFYTESTSTIAVVPELSSGILAMMSAVGFVLVRRRI